MRKTLLFLLLTYGASATMAAIFAASGGSLRGLAGTAFLTLRSLSGLAFLTLYMFVPMLMAIIVQRGFYRQPVVGPLGVSFRPNSWWLVGWLLPIAISFAIFGASLLVPGVSYSSDMSGMLARVKHQLTPEQYVLAVKQLKMLSPAFVLGLQTVTALVAGPTINAVFAFGEELGWRGLLLAQFRELTFWPASLLIGMIWGIWHAPVILMGYNYPHSAPLGVLAMTAMTIMLAPIFTYIRLRGKSVIATSIFHGTINASAGISLVYIKGGSEYTVGPTGLAGLIVLALVNLVLILYDRFSAKPIMGLKVAEFFPPF